jgi:hypothetical protein
MNPADLLSNREIIDDAILAKWATQVQTTCKVESV